MQQLRLFALSTILGLGLAACGSSSSGQPVPDAPVGDSAVAASLTLEVFTSPEAAGAVNSTVVMGERDAFVIDAQYTASGANAVADLVEQAGKTLTHVFISHAHPDHYFGATVLKQRFPQARVIAVPAVVEEMKATAAAKAEAQSSQLGPEFPGQPIIPEPIEGDTIEFEGHTLELLIGLQGDTDPVTGVLIRDNQTVVVSDVLFSGVHVWTADSSPESREAWMKQLDELAALDGVTRFVPGHQLPDADQGSAAIQYTKAYLETFSGAAQPGTDSNTIVEAMTAAYPDAGGAFFLQIGAKVNAGEMEWQ